MRLLHEIRLETARRVIVFCHRHPGSEAATGGALRRLCHILNQVDQILDTHEAAAGAATAARIAREVATARVRELLPHLVRFLAAAGISGQGRLRGERKSLIGIEGAAREALALAAEHRVRLREMDLPEELFEGLREALARHEAARLERGHNLALRASASEALAAAVADAMQAIRHLDAIYQVRFADDPRRLAAWNAIRSVTWGRRRVSVA